MGIRTRKNTLISALKMRALASKMTPEQVATFEQMYRRARSPEEQDEVTKVIDVHLNGWKTGTDAWSRILQAEDGRDFLSDDDDEDSPALKAALARSQVFLGRKPG